jgi:hypothetical protein
MPYVVAVHVSTGLVKPPAEDRLYAYGPFESRAGVEAVFKSGLEQRLLKRRA